MRYWRDIKSSIVLTLAGYHFSWVISYRLVDTSIVWNFHRSYRVARAKFLVPEDHIFSLLLNITLFLLFGTLKAKCFSIEYLPLNEDP
mmetsp:Transcript_39687/g.69746  ORF Transcript_39687/g.69746 Transcript_39687/m.69746 type:complete len:88 (+) Transcript_39687:48-311(+)